MPAGPRCRELAAGAPTLAAKHLEQFKILSQPHGLLLQHLSFSTASRRSLPPVYGLHDRYPQDPNTLIPPQTKP
jgi:hypothetical protein